MRDCRLDMSDETVSQMNKPQAYRKMIQRERNRRAGYGIQKTFKINSNSVKSTIHIQTASVLL